MMAKHRVVCPECGHRHTIEIRRPTVRGQVAGVRSKRITDNQFEHTINVPGEMVENDKYWSMSDQLLGAGVVGISFGAIGGYVAGQVILLTGFDVSIQCPIWGAALGLAYMWRFLYLERLWMLGERLPQAVGLVLDLAKRDTPTNVGVSLTVDHRYRDGATEAGRTINYFGTLPVDVERFNEYCKMALRGDSLAIGQLTGQGKLFTKQEYLALLAILQPAGVIVDLGGNKGNTLTGVGRRLLKRHLEQEVL